MRRLVFVDLDGTLLAGASEPRFIGHLLATRRIGPGACLRALSFALRHGACYTCYLYGAICTNPSSGMIEVSTHDDHD